jgi:hypothetical protein
MNTKKLLVAFGLVAASVAAQAQLTLTGVSFKLGAGFSSLGVTPTYNDALGTANVSLLTAGTYALGTVNSWVFTAVDTSDIGLLNYDITLNHLTPGTEIFAVLTAYEYDPNHPTLIGSEYGTGLTVLNTVDAISGSSASTQTLDLGYDLTSFSTMDAEYKLNVTIANVVPEPTGIAALSLGALGLLARRRRRNA